MANKPSADKRTVTTDALETLGTIIGENEKRDAIHLAVLPVQAGQKLLPGDDVGLFKGLATKRAKTLIGIVDPFLKEPVQEGERFWLVIYPRKINSLRHVWTHPEVDDATAAHPDESKPAASKVTSAFAKSEKWLREWAASIDTPFETVMAGAENYAKHGDYLCEGGRWEGVWVPDEFWMHYEVYTGDAEGNRGSFFSCSC